jgi:hypothetical protein
VEKMGDQAQAMQNAIRKAEAGLAGLSKEPGMCVRVAESARASDVQSGKVPTTVGNMSEFGRERHPSLSEGAESAIGKKPPLKSCLKKPP